MDGAIPSYIYAILIAMFIVVVSAALVLYRNDSNKPSPRDTDDEKDLKDNRVSFGRRREKRNLFGWGKKK